MFTRTSTDSGERTGIFWWCHRRRHPRSDLDVRTVSSSSLYTHGGVRPRAALCCDLISSEDGCRAAGAPGVGVWGEQGSSSHKAAGRNWTSEEAVVIWSDQTRPDHTRPHQIRSVEPGDTTPPRPRPLIKSILDTKLGAEGGEGPKIHMKYNSTKTNGKSLLIHFYVTTTLLNTHS